MMVIIANTRMDLVTAAQSSIPSNKVSRHGKVSLRGKVQLHYEHT